MSFPFLSRRQVFSSAPVVAGFLLFAAGCATYRAAPLDAGYVSAALAPADTVAIRVAAASLQHPYLKPLVFDLSDGLSASEASVLAVLQNPSLRAVRTERRIAFAQLLASGILPNPELSAGAEYPVNDTTGAATALSIGLGFDLRSLLTRARDRAAARDEFQQVHLDVAWQEWLVAQEARQQTFDALLLDRQLTLAKSQESDLKSNLGRISEARRRKLVPETERTAAETAYIGARATTLDLQVQLDTTRLSLLRTLGLPPDASIQIGPDAVPGLTPETLPPLDSLLDRIEQQRIDLAALRFGYDSQDSRLRLAIIRQFPTINIGITRATNDASLLTIGPGISIGLPLFDRNQGEIAIEEATREKLREEYVARLFDARSATATLHRLYHSLHDQLVNAQEATRAQRTLVDAYAAALRAGNADALTYYEARSSLGAAELAVLQLQLLLADATVALETTIGSPILAPQSSTRE